MVNHLKAVKDSSELRSAIEDVQVLFLNWKLNKLGAFFNVYLRILYSVLFLY